MKTPYVPPSACDRCCPVERHSTDWTVELAHETSCPNSPERTK